MPKKQLGLLLMSISAIGLGVTTILMKILPAEAGMTPGQIAVWRFLIAAPLMWLITLVRKKDRKIIPARIGWFLVLGGFYSMASLFALLALNRLPSSIYVIILFFYPSLVVIYHLVRRKPVPRLWWLGLPMAVVGLVLTVARFGQPVNLDLLGIILTVLNGLAIIAYMLLSERVFAGTVDRQLGSTWVMTGAMVIGLGLIALYGFSAPQSLKGWVYLFTMGIVGTLVPIFAMNIGIQMLGSARSSVVSTLQPVVAVLISTVFLHEVLPPFQWLGGVIVIVAIILLQRSPDASAPNSPHTN
ncbi:MAG: EamA family transporter [Anaerolineaceae bacterium]|nr:EamA family transporter [Anaerolineaceae bacterium]